MKPTPGPGGLLQRCLVAGLGVAAGAALAEESPWTLGVDNEVTWETVRTLSQVSPDSIADEYASKQVHPVLSFRCTEGGDGAVSMQIDWRRFISSFNTEAGFRVDDGERRWIKLGVDDSNRVTSAAPGDALDELVNRMLQGETLDVEISPYSESPVSVGFDLDSFPGAYDRLGAACGPSESQ